MGKDSVVVFTHHAAFGASPYDDPLTALIRRIAVAFSENPEMEWAEKYGTNIENEVFMMHQYCWCDRDDCPWCCGCTCPSEAYHYFVDGKEVTYQEWKDVFERMTGGWRNPRQLPHEEWLRLADEANRRRSVRHDPMCPFCRGEGPAAQYGGEPGKSAPNFWYKPTNLKVWWYKYIGRDMEANRPFTLEELAEIEKACMATRLPR